MTKADIEKQVKHWQDCLGLSEWSVSVNLVGGDDVREDAFSTIHINAGECKATITLAEGRSDNEQVRSVIHELVHVLLYQMWRLMKHGGDIAEYAQAEEKTIRSLVNALCQ